MNPETLPVAYGMGQRVKLTEKSFQRIVNDSKSIHAYPSAEFVEKLRPSRNRSGRVFLFVEKF